MIVAEGCASLEYDPRALTKLFIREQHDGIACSEPAAHFCEFAAAFAEPNGRTVRAPSPHLPHDPLRTIAHQRAGRHTEYPWRFPYGDAHIGAEVIAEMYGGRNGDHRVDPLLFDTKCRQSGEG